MNFAKKKTTEPDLLAPVRILIIAALILAFIIIVAEKAGFGYTPAQTAVSEPKRTGPIIDGNFMLLTMTYADMSSGDLILVNELNGIDPPQDTLTDVLENSASDGIQVSKSLAKPLNEWLTGSGIRVASGFRTQAQEQELCESGTSCTTSAPGHSEHQSGLCVDLEADSGADQTAQVYAWEYGFVRRYPADKSGITGVRSDASHFRYVGLPHSGIMKDYNLCLEEYLNTLKAYPYEGEHLKVDYLGKRYELYYCGGLEVPVPIDREYTLSGNNMDGFIVTIIEEQP